MCEDTKNDDQSQDVVSLEVPTTEQESLKEEATAPDTPGSETKQKWNELSIYETPCDSEMILTPLSAEELVRRKELEEMADEAASTWLLAMVEIRDKKLYRFDEHGSAQTWEKYCRRRFKMTKQNIDKKLRAEFVNQVIRETKVSEPLPTVAHADALYGLDQKEIVIAVGEVNATAKAENRKPKTADYKKARENLGKQKPAKPRLGKKKNNNAPVAPAKPHATKGNVESKVGNLALSISLTEPVANIVESIGELELVLQKTKNNDVTTLQINGNGVQQAHVLRSLAEWIKANGAMTVGVTLDK